MVLVPIHAPQRERAAVQEEAGVADLDPPETEADRRGFERPVVRVEESQGQSVERRCLCGPGVHRAQVFHEGAGRFANRSVSLGNGQVERPRRFPHRPAGRVEEGRPQSVGPGGGRRGVLDEGGEGEASVPVGVVEVGRHLEVAQVGTGPGEEADAAVYPADPPEVLALQVTPVAPAVHLDREEVRAGPQGVGEAELGRRPAALAVTDLLPVHEEEKGRIDALEAEEHFAAVPVGGDLEGPPVRADRVVVGRDARRVGGEGIGLVPIDRVPVAFEFPVRRHRDGAPAAVVVVGPEEVAGTLGGIRRPAEPPGTVEQERPGGFRGGTGESLFRRGERRETGPGFFPVHGEHGRVFPRRRFLPSGAARRDRERPEDHSDECRDEGGERMTGKGPREAADEIGESHRRVVGSGASGGARWPASRKAMRPKSAPQEWKGSLERRSSSPVPVIEE